MTLFVAYMYHRVLNLKGKLSLFQNLLEKPEEKKNEAALSMIQCKLLPVSWRTLNFFFSATLFFYFLFVRKRVFQPPSFSFLTLKGF